MRIRPTSLPAVILLLCAYVAAQNNATNSAVPKLIRFSGKVSDANGKPLNGVVGLTFSLYTEEQGGTPLWLETQNVLLDASGHYTIFLGASKPDGLRLELFASGEARWLGVQPQGQSEQSRVLLLAVPYALKAADAETVGGLPPSAFVRATPDTSRVESVSAATTSRTFAGMLNLGSEPTLPSAKTVNFLAKFINTKGGIGNSLIFDNGTNVGIGTTTPTRNLTIQDSSPGVLLVSSGGGSAVFDTNPGGLTRILASGSGAKIQIASGNVFDTGVIYDTTSFNLGLGTTAPASKLHVATAAVFDGIHIVGSEPSGAGAWFQMNSTGGNNRQFQLGADARPGEDGLKFQSDFANAFEFTTLTGAPLMTLQSGGNVGVGTLTPAARLEVIGSLKLTGSGNGITFPDGSSQTTASAQGPQGPPGPQGPQGAQGPPGPPVGTVAACTSDEVPAPSCGCNHVIQQTRVSNGGFCQVTSNTGSCTAVSTGGVQGLSFGICCVCSPN